MTVRVQGKDVDVTIRQSPLAIANEENRFGVSLAHANDFVSAFKNQRVLGHKVCNKYPISGRSASVHAETFLWSILNAKVIIHDLYRRIYILRKLKNWYHIAFIL